MALLWPGPCARDDISLAAIAPDFKEGCAGRAERAARSGWARSVSPVATVVDFRGLRPICGADPRRELFLHARRDDGRCPFQLWPPLKHGPDWSPPDCSGLIGRVSLIAQEPGRQIPAAPMSKSRTAESHILGKGCRRC